MMEALFYEFVNAINEQDTEKLGALMADEHKFIDAHGNEVTGKAKMTARWAGYFQLFPDYKIEITDLFVDGPTIAAFGFAAATFKGIKIPENANYWHIPAAWRVVIENDKIELWQVYADTKIPFDSMSR